MEESVTVRSREQLYSPVSTITPAVQPTRIQARIATPELGNHAYSSISFKSITPHAEICEPTMATATGLLSLCKHTHSVGYSSFVEFGQPLSQFPYSSDRATNWRYYLSQPPTPSLHSLPFKERSFVSWMFVDFPFACTFARQRGRLQMPRFSFSSTNHHHHRRSGKAIKIDNSA